MSWRVKCWPTSLSSLLQSLLVLLHWLFLKENYIRWVLYMFILCLKEDSPRLRACQMFTPSYFALQISFFAGLILNEVVNWVFKHILREPRPCAGRWSSEPFALWTSVADCIAVSPSKFRHMITFLLFQSFGHHDWLALLSFQSYLLGINLSINDRFDFPLSFCRDSCQCALRIWDALQSFPVNLVLCCLLLSFSVFKVRLCSSLREG